MALPQEVHDGGVYYHGRVHQCDDDARPDEDHGVVGEKVGEVEGDALGYLFSRVFVEFLGRRREGVGGEAERWAGDSEEDWEGAYCVECHAVGYF